MGANCELMGTARTFYDSGLVMTHDDVDVICVRCVGGVCHRRSSRSIQAPFASTRLISAASTNAR